MNAIQELILNALDTPWKARMHSVGAQNLTQNAFTKVAFDTVDYDPNGNLTTGVGAHYTVPANGYYLITCNLFTSTNSVNAELMAAAISKNNPGALLIGNNEIIYFDQQQWGTKAQALSDGCQGMGIIQFNQGDTVEAWLFQSALNPNTLLVGANTSNIAIHWLGYP